MKVKGKISKILPVKSGISKTGKEWKKQSFVIDNGDQYNLNICFSLFGDEKIKLLENLTVGQEVQVAFNLSSREFEGKWYHNVDAWKIEVGNTENVPSGLNDSDDDFDPALGF